MKQRWVWGVNSNSELGVGALSPLTTPALAPYDGVGQWAHLAYGSYHGAGVKEDGTLWTWGLNDEGQLGRTGDTTVPGQVAGTWKHVACGYNFTIGVKIDGSLWAWGGNFYGQLGIGSTVPKTVPTRVGTATDWKSAACGFYHAAAITTAGALYVWGNNASGELGTGSMTPTYRTSPYNINLALIGWSQVTGFALGDSFTLITDGNTAKTAGSNLFGSLGNNNAPVGSEYFVNPLGLGGVRNVFAGAYHAACITSTGAMYVWGYNFYGQLGLGDTTTRNFPVQLAGAWVTAALGGWMSFGIKKVNPLEGTLWSWGANTNYELGLGHTTQRTSPNQIGTATKWSNVSAAYMAGSALYFSTMWANFKGQYEA